MHKLKLLKISIFILLTISLCGIVLADNDTTIVENNIINDIKTNENIISENVLNENFIENEELYDNI